jgi:hypothetical protein
MATPLEIRHGAGPREPQPDALKLAGNRNPGKFGRLFESSNFKPSDDALFALAQAMLDPLPQDPSGDNPGMPAGFTYFGQFVDHDMTLDLTPLAEQLADPDAVTNFRTPALDLDALYGPGSQLAPFMYQRDPLTGRIGPKLIVGNTTQNPPGAPGGNIDAKTNDLPRSNHGRAILGDERNDENLVVAQTHLAFIKFHNKVVDFVKAANPALSGGALFEEARRLTTWHYQWIVLFDFVERLTEPGLIRRIKNAGRKFYRFRTKPFIPVEFSAAAYRLGHSMVREVYDYNRVFNTAAIPASLSLLFHFTGKSGAIVGDLKGDAVIDALFPPPGTQVTLPSNWIIDWRRFHDLGAPLPAGVNVNQARRLDPFITPQLHTLPGEADLRERNLAFRNLKRGVKLKLPSGQVVADKMGVRKMTPAEVSSGPDGAVAAANNLHMQTPLWYYILKEAQVLGGGTRLGPVGSTIVAEVFLGLVHGDETSFLAREANWKPVLPRANPDTFTMADMLNFVNDINPLG